MSDLFIRLTLEHHCNVNMYITILISKRSIHVNCTDFNCKILRYHGEMGISDVLQQQEMSCLRTDGAQYSTRYVFPNSSFPASALATQKKTRNILDSWFRYSKIKQIIKIWNDNNSIFDQSTCWTVEIRKDAVVENCMHHLLEAPTSWTDCVVCCKFLVLRVQYSLIGTDTWRKFTKQNIYWQLYMPTHVHIKPSSEFKF